MDVDTENQGQPPYSYRQSYLVLLRAQCIALIHGTAALRLHPTDEAKDKVPCPQTPEIITVGTPPPGPELTRVTPPGFEIQRATD